MERRLVSVCIDERVSMVWYEEWCYIISCSVISSRIISYRSVVYISSCNVSSCKVIPCGGVTVRSKVS